MFKVSIDFEGKEFSLEAGKYAKFANGSVMVRCGDTMVLVTVCASSDDKEGIDFLPLSVEYREKMSAAGKIPGGFIKREGKPSDREVLIARLIDRPCRPMFPKAWRRDTQIVAQVFSADPEVDPENLAAVGTSAALMISDIPFNGPISEVKVGRLNGEFIANPSQETLEECDIDMTVAGTDSSIVMVEGESNEISEEEFLEAIQFGHDKIKEINELQKKLVAGFNKEKVEVEAVEIPEEIIDTVNDTIQSEMKEYVYKVTSKEERGATRRSLRDKAMEACQAKFAEDEELAPALDFWVNQAFGKLEKKEMRSMIINDKQRLDGRKLNQVRPISTEVSVLPRVHGSALFTRGETQALASITLGSQQDEQSFDGLYAGSRNFFLHYNFPPFSVGETGRFGFTSRREVGHGNLAERALKKVMPSSEDFKYTVRIISDVLESNGSSSMATVCSGSMGMMDAGVPIKKPVAGIAMGLIMEEDGSAILSDILGDEDFLGDMDFKVAGTRDGITACQMDIKIEGLSVELMKTALDQAHEGRMHILDEMGKTITEGREDLSEFAPRMTTMKIPTDTIGAVIGTGGATIREITSNTGAAIDIEEDGTVVISTSSAETANEVMEIIKGLTAKPEAGKVYKGKVKEVREGLGALVEFMPKQVGLLHISQLQWEKTENVEDVVKQGEEIEVKLIEVSRDGKFKLSRKELLEKPEGYVEPEPRPLRDDRRRDDRRGNDRRGGRDDRRGGRNDRRDDRRSDRRDDRRSDDRRSDDSRDDRRSDSNDDNRGNR
jgi:polyribonucleotide nucleotidyltransferase